MDHICHIHVVVYVFAQNCTRFFLTWFFTLYMPFARPLARSLAPNTQLLAPHCSLHLRAPLRSFFCSLAPELMGKGILYLNWMRWFHAVSTRCGPRVCVCVFVCVCVNQCACVHACMHVSPLHCVSIIQVGNKRFRESWKKAMDGQMDRRTDGLWTDRQIDRLTEERPMDGRTDGRTNGLTDR